MTHTADTYGAFLKEVHALAKDLTMENVPTKTVEIGALLDATGRCLEVVHRWRKGARCGFARAR